MSATRCMANEDEGPTPSHGYAELVEAAGCGNDARRLRELEFLEGRGLGAWKDVSEMKAIRRRMALRDFYEQERLRFERGRGGTR